jgi:hypothetical protein
VTCILVRRFVADMRSITGIELADKRFSGVDICLFIIFGSESRLSPSSSDPKSSELRETRRNTRAIMIFAAVIKPKKRRMKYRIINLQSRRTT